MSLCRERTRLLKHHRQIDHREKRQHVGRQQLEKAFVAASGSSSGKQRREGANSLASSAQLQLSQPPATTPLQRSASANQAAAQDIAAVKQACKERRLRERMYHSKFQHHHTRPEQSSLQRRQSQGQGRPRHMPRQRPSNFRKKQDVVEQVAIHSMKDVAKDDAWAAVGKAVCQADEKVAWTVWESPVMPLSLRRLPQIWDEIGTERAERELLYETLSVTVAKEARALTVRAYDMAVGCNATGTLPQNERVALDRQIAAATTAAYQALVAQEEDMLESTKREIGRIRHANATARRNLPAAASADDAHVPPIAPQLQSMNIPLMDQIKLLKMERASLGQARNKISS